MQKFTKFGVLMSAIVATTALAGVGVAANAQTVKGATPITAGYLGQTTKSAIARNILSRLKNQREARFVAVGSPDRLLLWHEIALDSIAIDHTPDPDSGQVDFVQGGPTRTSRGLAMTEIAVFDAVNAFDRKYKSFDSIGRAAPGASRDVAIAYAAYGVQLFLYPSQSDRLKLLLESDLRHINATAKAVNGGKQVGDAAAAAIIQRRKFDRSNDPETSFGNGGRVATGIMAYGGHPINDGIKRPLEWDPDPLTPGAYASGLDELSLGAYWGAVTPFVMTSGDQFRAPPPPLPGSAEYKAAYKEVKRRGANLSTAGSTSTARTRFIGNFWGYDASPLLGTPPRLYNQIAVQVAQQQGLTDVNDLARYLAMINTGLADAGIAAWDTKYFYFYWRPVNGIRRQDQVPGSHLAADPGWKPVGISVINTTAPVIGTPPFPAYVSGHATFGATTFGLMRTFFPDNTPFTFVSDEYNGVGVDPFGTPRPLVPVRYSSLLQAQQENGQSRVYNGVHWQYDNQQGQVIGEKIAAYLPAHAFQLR